MNAQNRAKVHDDKIISLVNINNFSASNHLKQYHQGDRLIIVKVYKLQSRDAFMNEHTEWLQQGAQHWLHS